MKIVLSVLYAQAKTDPISFIQKCYEIKGDEELLERMHFISTIESCDEKNELLQFMAHHRNKEVKKAARLIATNEGLKIRRKHGKI